MNGINVDVQKRFIIQIGADIHDSDAMLAQEIETALRDYAFKDGQVIGLAEIKGAVDKAVLRAPDPEEDPDDIGEDSTPEDPEPEETQGASTMRHLFLEAAADYDLHDAEEEERETPWS